MKLCNSNIPAFIEELTRLFQIFKTSEAQIRPHFILTGPSGTGKSFNIAKLADKFELGFFEINAAQLTKEGTSGNSLSKALGPLSNSGGKPTICFVDEFDKLFISGNTNSEMAHESTNGVQNEFLKVLESDTTSVFGDYGKYINIPVDNVLFVFAGAFNGEEDLTLDRLREMGLKTEFLGRVGLVFNTRPISLNELITGMKESAQLELYLELFDDVKRDEVEAILTEQITAAYEQNTLGYRIITTLVNNYFIRGAKQADTTTKKVTFTKKLSLHA